MPNLLKYQQFHGSNDRIGQGDLRRIIGKLPPSPELDAYVRGLAGRRKSFAEIKADLARRLDEDTAEAFMASAKEEYPRILDVRRRQLIREAALSGHSVAAHVIAKSDGLPDLIAGLGHDYDESVARSSALSKQLKKNASALDLPNVKVSANNPDAKPLTSQDGGLRFFGSK
jgi:hypothetical protein